MEPLEPVSVKILPDGRLDAANAARYLGISTSTLAQHRTRGTGPRFTKLGGGKVFYFKADLDEWIAEGAVDMVTGGGADASRVD